MQDFLEQLDGQLASFAGQDASERAAASQIRHRSGARRGLRKTALALLGTVSTVAAAFAVVGTSAAELPILSTGTTDASQIRSQVPGAARAGVDFTAAHAFGTPGGPGYVLVNEAAGTLCIVSPDPAVAGSFGSTCRGPISRVERDGLALEMIGDLGTDPEASNQVAFILPEGAQGVQLRTGEVRTKPRIESGVATFATRQDAVLSWSVDGRPAQRSFEGAFAPLKASQWACPDGRIVTGSMPRAPGSSTSQRGAVRAARTAACAR